MGFSSYEELKAAVAERRKALLTLEVDLGGRYSQEYEDAKKELKMAEGLQTLAKAGGGEFLSDNLEKLRARVEALKPESDLVWVQYRQIDLAQWALLIKTGANMTATEQYEKVLPSTFVGLFGEDPAPDEKPEGWVKPEPLTTDPSSVSSKGNNGILSGGSLQAVVQAFMSWQNSGGEVSIRPTKSGQD